MPQLPVPFALAVQQYQFPTSDRQVEQSSEVFGRCNGDFFGRDVVQFRKGLRGLRDKSRFIALSPERNRRQPGRVRLNEDAIKGRAGCDIAQGLRLGVGQIPRKRNQKAEIKRTARLFPTSAETVHYAPKSGGSPMLVEHFEQVVPGVGCSILRPTVDEDRPPARGGNFKLSDKPFALNGMSGSLVVIIEADLATGDDFGFSEQGVKLGQSCIVGIGGVVGIDPAACIEARHPGLAVELPANIKGLVHFRRAFANADGQHCPYPSLGGAP